MAVSGSIGAFASVSSVQPERVLQNFAAIQPEPGCAEVHHRICHVLELLNDDVLPEKQQELLTGLLAIGTTSQGKSTPKLVTQLNQCLSLISNYLFYYQYDLSKFDNASAADLRHEIVVYIVERFNDKAVVFYFPKPQHENSIVTGYSLPEQAGSSHLVA
ncbi:MAG: hypothetical protein ACPGUD_07655 [Parashewanella sp.]